MPKRIPVFCRFPCFSIQFCKNVSNLLRNYYENSYFCIVLGGLLGRTLHILYSRIGFAWWNLAFFTRCDWGIAIILWRDSFGA